MSKNEYELKINSFTKSKQYKFFDKEVIEYVISLKDEIITELKKDSSKSDNLKIKHIRWIENYLDRIHNYLIKEKLMIPNSIKKHEEFTYITSKKLVERPFWKKKSLTVKKYDWMKEKYEHLKKTRPTNSIDGHARSIRNHILKDRPDFWDNHTYALETIINIIKNEKW